METVKVIWTHTFTSYESLKRRLASIGPTPSHTPSQRPDREPFSQSSNLESNATAINTPSCVDANLLQVVSGNTLGSTPTTSQVTSPDISQVSTTDISQPTTTGTTDITAIQTGQVPTAGKSGKAPVQIPPVPVSDANRPLSVLTFTVQKFHVSPGMRVDSNQQAVWDELIKPRLRAILLHNISSGSWVLEFMIAGKQRNDLKPTVIITCGNAATKRNVRKTFQKQGWLQQHLKDNDLAFIVVVADPPPQLSAKSASNEHHDVAMDGTYSIHLLQSGLTTSCGLKIRLYDRSHRPWRYCTLGGLLLVNGQFMGLTAGHPFIMHGEWLTPPWALDGEDPDDDTSSTTSSEAFVFNMGTNNQSETDSTDKSTGSSSASWNHHKSIAHSVHPGLEMSHVFSLEKWKFKESVICPQYTADEIGTSLHVSAPLDWALLKALPTSTVRRPNQSYLPVARENEPEGINTAISFPDAAGGEGNAAEMRESQIPHNENLGRGGWDAHSPNPSSRTTASAIEEVVSEGVHGTVSILIADIGIQSGYLHPSKTTIKVDMWVLEAQLITLDCVLPSGCSGAWVIIEGKLCGHIAMTRQDVPWAYMVPIGPILEDIKKTLNTEDVRLPRAADIDWTLSSPSRHLDTGSIDARGLYPGTQAQVKTELPRAAQLSLPTMADTDAPNVDARKPSERIYKVWTSSMRKISLLNPNRKPDPESPRTPSQLPMPISRQSYPDLSIPIRTLPYRSEETSPSGDPTNSLAFQLEDDTDRRDFQKHHVWLFIAAFILARFCMGLNETILLTAVPRITDDFASLSHVGWYLIAHRLGTTFGHFCGGRMRSYLHSKWMFLFGLFVFETGCFISAPTQSSTTFIFGRAITGVGASLMLLGMAPILDSLPRKLSSFPVLQCLDFAHQVACVVAPILGGAFTDVVTWRWCFYISLPIGGVVAVSFLLADHYKPATTRSAGITFKEMLNHFRLIAACLFYSSATCLLLAIQWGGSTYKWTNWRIPTLFVLFAVLLCFSLQFSRATTSFSVWRNYNLLAGLSFDTYVAAARSVLLCWIAIWFQAIKETNALDSGFNILPMTFSHLWATFWATLATGGKTYMGYYAPLIYISVILSTVGAGLLTTVSSNTFIGRSVAFQAIFGVGTGAGMRQLHQMLRTILPRNDAQSTLRSHEEIEFSRAIGSAIFIAVSQSVFSNILIKKLREVDPRLRDVNPASLVMTGISTLHTRVKSPKDTFTAAYNDVFTCVFYLALALSAASALGSGFVGWKKIKREDGGPSAEEALELGQGRVHGRERWRLMPIVIDSNRNVME